MKKKYLGLLALLSLLSVFAIWGQSVRADVDYDIDNVRAIARVNKDGSLTMYRTIKYSFDSDARGLYYKQNLAVKQKLSNIQVKVDGQNIKAATTGKIIRINCKSRAILIILRFIIELRKMIRLKLSILI